MPPRAFDPDLPANIPPQALPAEVRVVIEVARGGFLKRSPGGRIEFASPLPCPFNYGSAPDYPGEDGDPADVVLLGPRRPRGHEGVYALFGRVRFRDAGVDDPKWICGAAPPDEAELRLLDRFFSFYALVKLAWRRANGDPAESRYSGIDRVVDGRVVRALTGGTTRARFRAIR